LVSCQIDGIIFSYSVFVIERAPLWSLFDFWDFGRIMAVDQWSVSSKLKSMGFFTISIKFLVERVPSCRKYIGILGLRPVWILGQRVKCPKLKTILSPNFYVWQQELKLCSKKHIFLWRGSWLSPKSWTSRPRNQNSRPFCWAPHNNRPMYRISVF
jgi:hypothetical protein